MAFNVTFTEVELAEDVKNFISFNSDSYTDESLKDEIFDYDNDDLLKVTKNIGSPIKITKVEKITDELLDKAL